MALKCPLCSDPLRLLPLASSKWHFFNCRQCGYWTSRSLEGEWPQYAYHNAPDYRNDADDWNMIVEQASLVMKHKFRLSAVRTGRFLDIGCSEGAYVAASQALGWQACGCEVDQAKAARGLSRGLNVYVADILADRLAPAQADFVLLRHTLEHIPDFVQFAQAATKAVSPGGVLWVECPNQSALSVACKRGRVQEDRYVGALISPDSYSRFRAQSLPVFSAIFCR